MSSLALDRIATALDVETAAAIPIAIPYRRPLALATGIAREHCAVVIAVGDAGGRRGWGEIAPGPGTSRVEVAALAADLDGHGETVVELANRADVPAAVRAGIQAALLDLEARRRGLPLHTHLHSDAVPARVSVNAMIDRLPAGDARHAIDEAIAAGFRCLKIKLDACRTAECEELLRDVRRRHGDAIRLRLDCNGQWTLAEARQVLERLEPLAIEYVEQPVADLEDLRALRGLTAVRIAADEAAASFEQIERIVDRGAADILILKPSRVGPLDSLRAAAVARAAGITCVVTSNLESSLGIAPALHIAAIIDAQSDRPVEHGLGTVSSLEGDLAVAGLPPRDGYVEVPTGVGCGITPAPDSLARFSVIASPRGDAARSAGEDA